MNGLTTDTKKRLAEDIHSLIKRAEEEYTLLGGWKDGIPISDLISGLRGTRSSFVFPESGRRWMLGREFFRTNLEAILDDLGFELVPTFSRSGKLLERRVLVKI